MSQENIENAAVTEQIYCVKCGTYVIVTAPEKITMKSNRPALKGICPHCSTFTYKIISKNS